MSRPVPYFKVVYIKSLKELEPIPHSWEEEGICWFPSQRKEIKQFQCDALTVPDKINWPKYDCLIKASNITSWKLANEIANNLCNEPPSSASEEEDNSQVVNTSKRSIKSTLESSDFEYSHMFSNKKQKVVPGPGNKSKKGAKSEDKRIEIEVELPSQKIENPRENLTDSLTENNLEMQDITLTNDSLVLSSARDVKELKEAMDNYKLELSLQLNNIKDEIVAEVKSHVNDTFCRLSLQLSNLSTDIKRVDSEQSLDTTMGLGTFPLTSVEEIQSFEDKCSNEEYFKKMVHNLRRVIGTGQRWRSACYKLSSILFTKEVLTKYSWTGVSRSSFTKIPFNKLHNLLSIFYHVVKVSDNSFNYAQREVFFRDGILKHSLSRANSKKKGNKENTSTNQIEDPVLPDENEIAFFEEHEESAMLPEVLQVIEIIQESPETS